ncbi:Fungalysin metallopeptidase-domain-containing protein [Phlebopus sp. FC_14]|nr:Fungalysin metallopeptidase-domain-containing protein [Phlebopus sp. FC_14]
MHLRSKCLLGLLSVAVVVAHNPQAQDIPRRKTLGFGPILPHATHTTSPDPHILGSALAPSLSSDPFEVAKAFLQNLVPSRERASFVIRPDSYTDERTEVTHVYVKQVIDGLEVANGKINLNIKGGEVLSYGDSFYRGELPGKQATLTESSSSHAGFCETVFLQLDAQRRLLGIPDGQAPLQISEWRHHASIKTLEHLHTTHCAFLARRLDIEGTPDDPRAAALMFMIAATPSSELADDITANFDDYMSNVTPSRSHPLQQTHGLELTLAGIPDTVNPVVAKLVYAQVPVEDTVVLRLAWKLEVEMRDNWYEATVDAYQPSYILAVADWASDSPVLPYPSPADVATYNVFKFGINDPSEGERSLEKENIDWLASPLGWHSLPEGNMPFKPTTNDFALVNYTSTAGNNVFAHENWDGGDRWTYNYRPDAGLGRTFDFPYAPSHDNGSDPLEVAKSYINASVTQLFYTANMVHDLFYRYGFDEKSGNFQQHNFGRGGKEGDAVIANAQDGGGFSNANFMTPPDGRNGRCRMYLWDTAYPYRDGDFEAGIVIHELTHGLSVRLTGGSDDSGCLGWGESSGLGEGWGDFLATLVRNKGVDQDYPMGAWAANEAQGIRDYLYSVYREVNPITYESLNKPEYWGTHGKGEVWAEILWVTAQALIKKHGLSETLFPPKPGPNGDVPAGDFYRTPLDNKQPSIPIHGNTLMMQLVIDGMKLQPCWPDFFDARDSIIYADKVLTGGENECTLWEGFASRGLGPKAANKGATPWGGGTRVNDFSIPVRCAK